MVSAEKKKKEKKKNKWPTILFLSKEGYINYKIPKIHLKTNIGYYSLKIHFLLFYFYGALKILESKI